jgi:hypothetical protein
LNQADCDGGPETSIASSGDVTLASQSTAAVQLPDLKLRTTDR